VQLANPIVDEKANNGKEKSKSRESSREFPFWELEIGKIANSIDLVFASRGVYDNVVILNLNFTQPYSNSSFNATQVEQYSCNNKP
jgi:hypothetical protein